MIEVFQVETDEHKRQVRLLFWEYLQWANAMVGREFGVTFDIETMLKQDMKDLAIFFPPPGRLLLATYETKLAGIGCMRKIGEGTGEIKRMYVRPSYRSKGIGRALVGVLLAEARQENYLKVRLDSARFMHTAHTLYQSLGFKEIAAYEGSEIPEAFQTHWVFMELALK
jgi:GNAT superfamily N-acetyltransferase